MEHKEPGRGLIRAGNWLQAALAERSGGRLGRGPAPRPPPRHLPPWERGAAGIALGAAGRSGFLYWVQFICSPRGRLCAAPGRGGQRGWSSATARAEGTVGGMKGRMPPTRWWGVGKAKDVWLRGGSCHLLQPLPSGASPASRSLSRPGMLSSSPSRGDGHGRSQRGILRSGFQAVSPSSFPAVWPRQRGPGAPRHAARIAPAAAAAAADDSRRGLEAGWELTQLGPAPISSEPIGGGGGGRGHVVSQPPRATVAPGCHAGASSLFPLPTLAQGVPGGWKRPPDPWGESCERETGCPWLRIAGQPPKAAGGTRRQEPAANSPAWGKLRHGHRQQERLGRVKLPSSQGRAGFVPALLSRQPPTASWGTPRGSARHQPPANSPCPWEQAQPPRRAARCRSERTAALHEPRVSSAPFLDGGQGSVSRRGPRARGAEGVRGGTGPCSLAAVARH